jgi:GNAT superfamily N-acetyltransferase
MQFRAELIDPRVSRELRRSVLRPHVDPSEPLPGDEIADAVHIGAFADVFKLASTCFIYPDACPWLPDERPAWHLRQMATHPDWRGQGAGGAVLRTAVDYVAATGGGLLWCNARLPALDFYARHGLRMYGETHDSGEPPIPHKYLWRRVAAAVPESAERAAEIREQVVEGFDTDRQPDEVGRHLER